jgi:hypothetical protein
MDGAGTYLAADGKKYVGGYKNGQMDGNGILYNADGSIESKGTWLAGNFKKDGSDSSSEFDFPETSSNDAKEPSIEQNPKKQSKKSSNSQSASASSSKNYFMKNKDLENVFDAKWLFGISGGNGAQYSTGQGSTDFNLGVSGGYFVSNKIAVGANIAITYSGSDGEGETETSFSPFGKYFINKKFAVGAQAIKAVDWELGVFGNYILRLSNNITFEPSLSYIITSDNSPITADFSFFYYY